MSSASEHSAEISPFPIQYLAMRFWSARVLHSAAELRIFTLLGDDALSRAELMSRVGITGKIAEDFVDALVGLELLERDQRTEGVYLASPQARTYLDENSSLSIVSIVRMVGSRQWEQWTHLTDALRTGASVGPNEQSGRTIIDEMGEEDREKLKAFAGALGRSKIPIYRALASVVPFEEYASHLDVGGGVAMLSSVVAAAHPHLRCQTFDRAMDEYAAATIEEFGVADRVTIVNADYFRDPFPPADVITMSNVLHDWDDDRKRLLIGKAAEALNEGGLFVALEMVNDPDRSRLESLLMSINMFLEMGGSDFTVDAYAQWVSEAGLELIGVEPLAGPTRALISRRV